MTYAVRVAGVGKWQASQRAMNRYQSCCFDGAPGAEGYSVDRMTYTFWHSGILIGESDCEDESDNPRHLGGVFRPTAYGLELFPRLCGILTAGHALKAHLDAHGLDPDEMERDEIEELLDTNPAGQKILDIGRALSEVEMRAPDGTRLEFASIGFIDTLEMERVGRELRGDSTDDPIELPSGAPRYFVSATLSDDTPAPITERQGGSVKRRRWQDEN